MLHRLHVDTWMQTNNNTSNHSSINRVDSIHKVYDYHFFKYNKDSWDVFFKKGIISETALAIYSTHLSVPSVLHDFPFPPLVHLRSPKSRRNSLAEKNPVHRNEGQIRPEKMMVLTKGLPYWTIIIPESRKKTDGIG